MATSRPPYIAPTDTKNSDHRQKALQTAIDQIEKIHGKGAIMRMGDDSGFAVSALSTGSISVDLALGIGGLPRGRIVEIFGPESSGKTTLALHVIASAQRNGGEAAFIDAEHALDPVYAQSLGVDLDSLLVAQPDNGEQSLEICEALVRSGALDVIVIDSVAALVPRAELEGNMGDSVMGLHARLMSQAMRKLAGSLSKTNTVAVFINQLRESVKPYGPSEVTTGGRALKFYSSVRIDVRKGSPILVGSDTVGAMTDIKIVKNKTAPPFRFCTVEILFGEGISHTGEIIDLGIRLGLVRQSGTWFAAGETRLGQGRDNARRYLKEHPDLCQKLEDEIRANASTLTMSKPAKRTRATAAAGQGIKVNPDLDPDFDDDNAATTTAKADDAS